MRTSWLPAQGGVLRIPVLGGKRSEKKGVGQWKDPQLMVVRLRGRGDTRLTKDGRKQGCPAQPGSQTPGGKPMHLGSPTGSQAAGGAHPKASASPGRPPEPPVPTVRACDGECVCKS